MYSDNDAVYELQRKLSSADIDSDVIQTRKLLGRVMQCTTAGLDTQDLFPLVVKSLASSDIVTKKLACWFVTQHGSQTELILLAVNSLLKDCESANPMIRGLALKTLSGLPQSSFVDYSIQPILKGLKDTSAYVRRIAVISSVKVHHLSPDVILENGIVDQLYGLIRDSDPIIVANCLSVLEEILQEEGGIVVNRNIAHHLLNRLTSYTEWCLVTVFRVLKKYRPKTEEEIFDAMNLADGYLRHNTASVSTSALEYFLHLIEDLPHLKQEIFKRAQGQILHFLGSGNAELTMMLLQHIESLLLQNVTAFTENYRSFFCKYNEPSYVKERRIAILPKVTSEDNLEEILEEINMYCLDIAPGVALAGIQAISQIASRFPNQYNSCIKRLLQLLEVKMDHVVKNTLLALQKMRLHTYGDLPGVLEAVHKCTEIVCEDDEGKAAIVYLMGEHGECYDESPYVLEAFVQDLQDDASDSLKMGLLLAAVKLFLKRPAECQELLGGLLEVCMDCRDVLVQDRACFYYQLLASDAKESKQVLQVINDQW